MLDLLLLRDRDGAGRLPWPLLLLPAPVGERLAPALLLRGERDMLDLLLLRDRLPLPLPPPGKTN